MPTLRTKQYFYDLLESGYTLRAVDLEDLVFSMLHYDGSNFPDPLPAVDGSALTGIATADPLPAVDGSALLNVAPTQWRVPDDSVVYLSSTQFAVDGDATSLISIGRPLRLKLLTGGYFHTTASAVAYNSGLNRTEIDTNDTIPSASLAQVEFSLLIIPGVDMSLISAMNMYMRDPTCLGRGMAYGKGTLLVVGGGTGAAYTKDFYTFTDVETAVEAVTGTSGVDNAVFDGTNFVVSGYVDPVGVAYSADGAAWTASTGGSAFDNGRMAAGGGEILMVDAEDVAKLYYSTNSGVSFSNASNIFSSGIAYNTKIIFDGTNFFITGHEAGVPKLKRGPDHANLTTIVPGFSVNHDHTLTVAYGDGVHLCTADYNGDVAVSTDGGTNWTIYNGALPDAPDHMAWGGGLFLAAIGATLYASRDGINWEASWVPPLDLRPVKDLAFFDNRWLAGCSGSFLGIGMRMP